MAKPSIKIGDRFETNQCGTCEVVSYENQTKVGVRFLNTGKETICRAKVLRKGGVLDKYAPLLHNTGFIGVGKYTTRVNNEKTKAYHSWARIIKRCYQTTCKDYPIYGGAGVTVDKEWHNFQNFAEWFYKEPHSQRDGYKLDKDLMVFGSKIYSEGTCSFVSNRVNCILNLNYNLKNKLPIGVTFDINCRKYRTNSHLENRVVYRGCYDCPDIAFDAYCKYKYEVIKDLAELEYSLGNINENVYNTLINFKIPKYRNN